MITVRYETRSSVKYSDGHAGQRAIHSQVSMYDARNRVPADGSMFISISLHSISIDELGKLTLAQLGGLAL